MPKLRYHPLNDQKLNRFYKQEERTSNALKRINESVSIYNLFQSDHRAPNKIKICKVIHKAERENFGHRRCHRSDRDRSPVATRKPKITSSSSSSSSSSSTLFVSSSLVSSSPLSSLASSSSGPAVLATASSSSSSTSSSGLASATFLRSSSEAIEPFEGVSSEELSES